MLVEAAPHHVRMQLNPKRSNAAEEMPMLEWFKREIPNFFEKGHDGRKHPSRNGVASTVLRACCIVCACRVCRVSPGNATAHWHFLLTATPHALMG